jgi:hypothetical protein
VVAEIFHISMKAVGWLGGWVVYVLIIMPDFLDFHARLSRFSCQTFQIFSWAEISRWGRVWQYAKVTRVVRSSNRLEESSVQIF